MWLNFGRRPAQINQHILVRKCPWQDRREFPKIKYKNMHVCMSAALRVEGACMHIALQKSKILGTGDPKKPEASNTAELFLEDRGPLMILDDVVAPTVT